jgi:simple sugar transport system permease protein
VPDSPHETDLALAADLPGGSQPRPGAESPIPSAPSRRERYSLRLVRRPELGAFVALALIYLLFALVANPAFVGVSGTASWMNTASELGVLAIPVGMLMIAGEFDLSVGSVVGAASMIVAVGTGYYHLPMWLSIAIAIVVAVLIGIGNGFLTVRTRLPSFIVTLAGLFIVQGAALGLASAIIGTSAMAVYAHGSAAAVFGSAWNNFDVSIIWWIGLAGVASWVLHKTRFGNWIFATGGKTSAARAAGVPTNFVKITLFVCTATGAALVGILEAIQFNSGDVTYGSDLVFSAPVAAVVGGVLLGGGFGSAMGIVFGTAIYGILTVGISYTRLNSDWVDLFIGALLLIAVLANNLFRRLAMKKT